MDERQVKLQRHRLRMTSLSVVNSLLQSGIVALYAWSGTVSWEIALAFFVASLLTTGFFAGAVALNWNLRFSDEWLLYAQLAAFYLIQLVFIVVAPTLWMIFLASTLVAFNYAMVSFTPRQFTWGWLGFGATTAIALYLGHDRFGNPAVNSFNIAVLWLFFFLAVRRLALIGMQFSKLRGQLSEKNRALTESLARIQELASHDELTGAFNRRHFMQLLNDERARANRTGQIFAVAIFDLDHFKAINDRFGHQAGDTALCDFCDMVHAGMRSTDRFARYGGEEFAMLMPATTSAETASVAAERIRASMHRHVFSEALTGHPINITVSVGVASYRPDESISELLARADAALYEAKRGGRDRVEMSA